MADINSVSLDLDEVANPMYQDGNTAGIGKYVDRMSSTVQNYDVNTQLLRGTMCFSKAKLQELDPSYQGYTHVFVLRTPPVLANPANGMQLLKFENNQQAVARAHCRNLKALFEMGCTSYSGTPSLTMNTDQVQTGWNERSYPAPTTSAYDSTSFTLRVLETRGEPLRRGLEYYISAISDPNVKAWMMNGATISGNDGPLLEPTLANITWSFMIVQTDQTLLHIQDVSIWNSCIVTNVDRSNLDWENGTVSIVAPRDVTFNGVYMPDAGNNGNPWIDEMAQRLLTRRLKFYQRYRDMGKGTLGADTWDQVGVDFGSGGNTDAPPGTVG